MLYLHEQVPKENTPVHQQCYAADAAAAAAALKRAARFIEQMAEQGITNKARDKDSGAGVVDNSDGAAEQQDDRDDPLEPASAGANNSLDDPAHIDLQREAAATSVAAGFVDLQPSFHSDPANWTAFSLAIMLPSGIAAAKRRAHQGTLQLDSTFV